MGRGPLRNFFSGIAASPVAKAIGDTSFAMPKNQQPSLAQKQTANGYNVSFKPLNNTPSSRLATTNLGAPNFSSNKSNAFASFKPISTPSSDVIALEGLFGKSSFAQQARGNITVPSFDSSTTATASNSVIGDIGGSWSKVDALNNWIMEAANTHDVDPNILKAIMKLESGGEWIISHAGAVGYMQVVPKYWGDIGYDLNDPRQNILAGAKVFKYYLDQAGGDVYEALRGYHGYGFDGFTTDTQYADVVMKNYNALKQAGGTYYGGGTKGGLGSGWGVMLGNFSTNVSQEFGMTAFAAQNMNGMYAYAPSYGVNGHPGVDVSMPRNSVLRAPSSGTVIRSGGSGYYCDTSGCGPGQGELKIKLDNGDEIILGHMSRINVTVGQKVAAGQAVGLSGTQNGDHVHVEYRTPDSSTSSGWRAIDPRGGVGVQGTTYQQPIQLSSPMSFMNPAIPMPFAIPSYALYGYGEPVNFLEQWRSMKSGG